MNSLVIPPPPNWYENSILACAPDNTLIYGSRNDIVVVQDTPDDQPANIGIIPRAHSQKIVSTNINKNWGQPNKLLVTAAEDKIIKLWNIDLMEKKIAHNEHAQHRKVIGATFAGDEKVISVSEEGVIIVWNISINQTNTINNVFGFKVTVTCISTCPHVSWLTAFGLKSGLLFITDLRKDGKILYKLRGHDKSVLSLAWCPAPVNIFPKDPNNHVGTKERKTGNPKQSENANDACKSETTGPESVVSENKGEASPKKNIWANIKHADDDDSAQGGAEQSIKVDDNDDFLKECQTLKDRILSDADITGVLKAEKDHDEKQKPKLENKNQKTPGERMDMTKECEENLANSGKGTRVKARKNKKRPANATTKKSTIDLIDTKVEETALTDREASAENKAETLFSRSKQEVPLTAPAASTESKDMRDQSCTGEEAPGKSIVEPFKPSATKNKSEMLPTKDEEISPIKSDSKSFIEEMPSPIIVSKEKDPDGDKENIAVPNLSEDGGAVSEQPGRVPIDEEPRKEFLLASSGREGNIYIWRAGTDGRMQTFLTLPSKPSTRKYGRNPEKTWIVLCWVTPNILLSSSKSAELIKWNLPKPRDPSKQHVIIHNDHGSLLFSIAAPIIRLTESNWLDKQVVNGKERQINAWTVGHDRLLLSTSLEVGRKNLVSYPTIGKSECFAGSPIDSNRLAIGTADGIIKVWDLSQPHIKNIVMTNYYQKIQGKVVSLAWHPINEVILAYGTSEGRVGYIDTNKKKIPTLLPNFFKTQIHKVEWGPMDGNTENIGLFAVSEGKLVVFDIKAHEKEPQEVETPDNTYVYTIAWKPNYELLLVSTKTGALITYSTDLKILSTQYLQHKLQHIYWHSTATSSDLEMSKYCYYFAAIANFKELIVYNYAIKTDKEDRVVSRYKTNGELINDISWNPYSKAELVIAREDGVAQVWNIDSNTVVSTYINPNFEGLSSVIWSPCEAEFVITASKDHTITIWNKSEFPAKNEKEISDLRKAVIKKISNEASSLLLKLEKTPEETVKVKKSNRTNLLPNFYTIRSTSQVINDLRKLLHWKEGETRDFLDDGDDEPNILDIFDSSDYMLQILLLNETIHKQKGKYHLESMLSLYRGDIRTSVKAAIDEKRVTPWVIMMAPMVSHKVWYAACEVYAQQLSVESDSDPLEVASLYLMCHKVEEAIKILCESSLYREALTLAKCRLPSDDPTITDIIKQWGTYSLTVGNFELAAQCNIVLGRYEAAAAVLFRRSNLETLKFAVEVAEKSGNKELHHAVLSRYYSFAEEEENRISENEVKLPTKVEAIILKEQTKGRDEKVGSLQKPDGDGVVESHSQQEVSDSVQTSVSTKAETILQKDQAEGSDKKDKLLQKSNRGEGVKSHEPEEEAEGNVAKFKLLKESERDELVKSCKLQEVNDSEQTRVPTKVEAISQKDQTEGSDKNRSLEKSDGDEEVEDHELQEVGDSEQTSVSTKAETKLLKEQAEGSDEKVRVLDKSRRGDEVKSQKSQEENSNQQKYVPAKSEANLPKEQIKAGDKEIELLEKSGDEVVESVKLQEEIGSEPLACSLPISSSLLLKEQAEGSDEKTRLLKKSNGDEVESPKLQEANGNQQNFEAAKSEANLSKEGSDEEIRVVSEESDGDEEANGSLQNYETAKSEANLPKEETEESDEEIRSSEESDGDEVVEQPKEQVEGSGEKVSSIQKSDRNKKAESCEVLEMNGGADLSAKKKLFSDESSGRIEGSVSKEHEEVGLINVNTGSLGLDSAAKPPEEQGSGYVTPVQEHTEGLLTTEVVRRLLSNARLVNDPEVKPADLNKSEQDKCF